MTCPKCNMPHLPISVYEGWLATYPRLTEQGKHWQATIDYHNGDKEAWAKLKKPRRLASGKKG